MEGDNLVGSAFLARLHPADILSVVAFVISYDYVNRIYGLSLNNSVTKQALDDESLSCVTANAEGKLCFRPDDVRGYYRIGPSSEELCGYVWHSGYPDEERRGGSRPGAGRPQTTGGGTYKPVSRKQSGGLRPNAGRPRRRSDDSTDQ